MDASLSLQDRTRQAASAIKSQLLHALSADHRKIYDDLCHEKKVTDLLEASGNLDSDEAWTEWILWTRKQGRIRLVRDPTWSKEEYIERISTTTNRARFAGGPLTLNFFEILVIWKGGSKSKAHELWKNVADSDPSIIPKSQE
jgi:hypothetical protein